MSIQSSRVPASAHTVKSLFVTGFCMGFADAIPGISGASIAFVAGIYAELIDLLKKLNPIQIGLMLKEFFMFSKVDRRETISYLAKAQGLFFLLPLIFGICVALVVASFIIHVLLASYPQQANSLFFGIMLASVTVPLSAIAKKSCLLWLIVIFFAWLAYGLVVLPPLNMSGSLYFTFFSGAIAICAVILPGISGGVLLQALGLYEFIASSFYQALHLQADAVFVILVFAAGMILGITSFVRILSSAFHFYPIQTYAALTGMMLGALRAVWPFQDMQTRSLYFPSSFHVPEIVCLVLFLTGVLITCVLFGFNRRSF